MMKGRNPVNPIVEIEPESLFEDDERFECPICHEDIEDCTCGMDEDEVEDDEEDEDEDE